MTIREKVFRRFKLAYVAAGGKQAVGIEDIFTVLMEFLKQFLENCGAKDVKDLPDAFILRKLTQKGMDEGQTRKEAKLGALAGLKVVRSTSSSDLEAL